MQIAGWSRKRLALRQTSFGIPCQVGIPAKLKRLQAYAVKESEPVKRQLKDIVPGRDGGRTLEEAMDRRAVCGWLDY